MHKELFVLGIISILAVGVLFIGSGITGLLIESEEVYELGTQIFKHAPQSYPRLSYVPLAGQASTYDPAELPSQEYLAPETISFAVNRIPLIGPNFNYPFSLKKDRIHTYSGSAGYYEQDPGQFIEGYLCSYAYKIQGAPLRCEQVPLAFADGELTFAQGYPPDEYIAHQATGTDFAAVFILTNPDYGILASSPVAYLRWTSR